LDDFFLLIPWKDGGLDFRKYLEIKREQADRFLREYIQGRCGEDFPHLKEVVEYSLLSGGKRLRPILTLAACETAGGDEAGALPFGCALEMVHTFSLIHDDLPAMDNDDFRRSRPTSHKVFGEAHAILAGDALLTEAFRVVADPSLYADLPVEVGMEVMRELVEAAGLCGMVGGQSMDLLWENKPFDEDTLICIHRCKTARFIAAAVVTGGIVARAEEDVLSIFRQYGENVGMAFQIKDDILNETGKSGKIGKSVGSDARHGKATYPALFGIEESRRKAEEFAEKALSALYPLGDGAGRLREIARFIVDRDH